MLKALYDYAVSHELTLPDGYVNKTVAAYIMFSSGAPDFVSIWMGDDRKIICPDIGSLANSKEKSNIIIEKRSVVIPDADNAKSAFFRNALSDFGSMDADAKLCTQRLDDPALVQRIQALLDENKIKAAQRISFMVDGRMLHDSPDLLPWWQVWRQKLLPPKKGALAPCLITGELISPIATAPSIKGLRAVGGHSSGDALICFDKPAFCSYGQKQGANAPVSESAMGAVNAALNELLSDAPILCGMKFVHWFDRDVEKKDDPVFSENFFGFGGEEEEPQEASAVTAQDELQARRQADHLIRTAHSGESAVPLGTDYHILLLSGVGGRVMVRRYERGKYEQLQQNLEKWNRDLALKSLDGETPCRSMKLSGRLIRLLKYQKSDRNVLDRLGKELSGITPSILTAIVYGGRLPDTVAIRALAYIRSRLLASEEEQNGSHNLDSWAFQWLKAWLIRNDRRSEEHMKETYYPDHPEAAYHCGAAMAVHAAIQNRAMPDVNASIAQRFFASCIKTPALVLGRLSQLSVHHLAKIKNPYLQNHYRELLGNVYCAIGSDIPVTLDLEKQSYFALGYYQMSARINLERIQAANKNKAQEET